jgi:hypothetical protein
MVSSACIGLIADDIALKRDIRESVHNFVSFGARMGNLSTSLLGSGNKNFSAITY